MSMSRGLVVIAATLLVAGATTAWNRGYRIVILPPPLPAPVLQLPTDGTILDDNSDPGTTMEWTPVQGAAGYIVELDTFYPDSGWTSAVGELRKSHARFPSTRLYFRGLPGRWRWRVYALDRDDNKGLKSPWREIRYQP